MAALPLRVSIDEVLAPAGGFDTWIDARSPGEYADDHLPGAVNWPVLDDAQRARVGTLYVQESALAARKLGAALVARNIAGHVEAQLADKPREWRPLVYCWRGGQRSGSLALVLAQIGFRTAQLEGGYKAFRARVRRDLGQWPGRFDYRVLCGRTGSGKTRLLQALRRAGEQVLDLEGLAHHRGSVLGAMPGLPQPTQKAFDTRIWQTLAGFDAARPVYVESESAKIGALRVPEPLLAAMHGQGVALRVLVGEAARVAMLLDDYRDAMRDPEPLCRLLDGLVELRGRDRVQHWQALARASDWPALVSSLMREHYDPLYDRSMRRSWPSLDAAWCVELTDGSDADLSRAAAAVVALHPGNAAAPVTHDPDHAPV